MRTILFVAALVCLLLSLSAQDYAPKFALQPFTYQLPHLNQGNTDFSNPVPSILGKTIRKSPATPDLNMPVEVQPVIELPNPIETVTSQPEPKPAKPERIPWPEPGYNCCWPQNIDGSLHVNPDSFGGGN